jgi:hypothetical protein
VVFLRAGYQDRLKAGEGQNRENQYKTVKLR